jgi:orotidine-5'-phosphate decarboxylase
MHLDRKTHLILALDVEKKETALSLSKMASEYVDAIKIGYPLILNVGISVAREIASISCKPVVADLKIADIPYIARLMTRIAIDAGCDGIMVHGFAGPRIVEECVVEDIHKMVFVVTELTDPSAASFTRTLGPVAEKIATMAKEVGAYGIQAPATRPDRIVALRRIVGTDMTIVACGVGRQGAEPGSAIRAGADFEIVGRAIYAESDPLKSLIAINKKITGISPPANSRKS